MAEIVGGDLYHLWRVSDVHLPRIADVYYDANRAIAGAGGGDEGAFPTRPSGPGTYVTSSPSGAAWAALRDELQRMYGEIGETVLEAGEAIRQARQAYIDADMVCADTLSQYLADPANHDPNNPASNPPVKGADDNPGEPVMP